MQQIRRSVDIVMSQTGARGHMLDLHAYKFVNKVSCWASRALWKRQEVKETTIQLMKNEALVMETNQLSAVVPPAKAQGQYHHKRNGGNRSSSLSRDTYQTG